MRALLFLAAILLTLGLTAQAYTVQPHELEHEAQCPQAFNAKDYANAVTVCGAQAADYLADAQVDTGEDHYVELSAAAAALSWVGISYLQLGQPQLAEPAFQHGHDLCQSVQAETKDEEIVAHCDIILDVIRRREYP